MSDQHEARDTVSDYCSETESEDGNVSDNILNTEDNDGNIANNISEEFDDDVVLASLVHKSKSSKTKASKIHSSPKNVDGSCDMDGSPEEVVSKSFSNHSGRKRVRVVISDDEAEEAPEIDQSKRTLTGRADSLSTSGTCLLTYEHTILSVVAVGAQNIFLLIVRYIFSVSNRANCKCSKQKQKSGYTILNPLKLCYWKEFKIFIICIASIVLICSIRY